MDKQNGSFSIFYSGRLQAEKDLQEVAQAFAKKLRIPQTRAKQILNSARPVCLKTGVDQIKAEKMKQRLEAMGLVVDLVPDAAEEIVDELQDKENTPQAEKEEENTNPLDAAIGLELEPLPETAEGKLPEQPSNDQAGGDGLSLLEDSRLNGESDQKAATSKASEPFQCPKCQTVQDKGESCISCGVIFIRFEKAQENAEDKADDEPLLPRLFKAVFGEVKGLVSFFAGAAILFYLLAKKIGILKFAAVAAGAGLSYDGFKDESISLCLGNQECEQAVEAVADSCWDSSGMDSYNWDDMSESEFNRIYPEMEKKFFGCLTYPDGRPLFLKPFYLTVTLNAYCYDEACMQLADQQQWQCYEQTDLSAYADELTRIGDLSENNDNTEVVMDFFKCFKDKQGQPLFAELYDYMDAS